MFAAPIKLMISEIMMFKGWRRVMYKNMYACARTNTLCIVRASLRIYELELTMGGLVEGILVVWELKLPNKSPNV